MNGPVTLKLSDHGLTSLNLWAKTNPGILPQQWKAVERCTDILWWFVSLSSYISLWFVGYCKEMGLFNSSLTLVPTKARLTRHCLLLVLAPSFLCHVPCFTRKTHTASYTVLWIICLCCFIYLQCILVTFVFQNSAQERVVEANRGIDVTEKKGTLGKAVLNEKGRAVEAQQTTAWVWFPNSHVDRPHMCL